MRRIHTKEYLDDYGAEETAFLNEIKGYTEEQLLGEDNGIGDERAVLLLTGMVLGMFTVLIAGIVLLVKMI